MNKIKALICSPHIHIALAAGASIIVMAYFSKHILEEPIKYLPQAIPPFFFVIWEGLNNKHKDKWFLKSYYWVSAIFLTTTLVILFSCLKSS